MIPPATHSLRQLTPSPYWVVAEVMTEEATLSEGKEADEGNVRVRDEGLDATHAAPRDKASIIQYKMIRRKMFAIIKYINK